MGMIWNTINVILYVPQAEQIMRLVFFVSFMNVYDVMFVCVCVNLYACEIFFVVDLLYACERLCYEKDYFESTYPHNTASREKALSEKF